MANTRYPHQCTIYRYVANALSDSEEKITIYPLNQCRVGFNSSLRIFDGGDSKMGKVDTATVRVSMPDIIQGIQKGDYVDVITAIGELQRMRISTIEYSEMANSTAVICTEVSN